MLKNPKSIQCIALLFLVIFYMSAVTGCGEHIEDPDESSHELTTLTIADFTGGSYRSTSSGVSMTRHVSRQTIQPDNHEIDFDHIERRGGKTSGVTTLMGTRLREGERLRIDTSVSPQAGNIGLALISPANEILYMFKIDGADSFSFTAAERGIYLVRAGMESFSGEIILSRTWE